MDSIPTPDFSLIKYHNQIRIYPVMTSRGCPYNCNFCYVPGMFGREYRTRSEEKVLEDLKPHDGKKVFIADDHLAANPKRLERMLDLFIDEGLNVNWSGQVRVEITKSQHSGIVEKMKQTGCHDVYVGFESIDPRTLKEIGKDQTVDDIKRTIKVFHDYGIGVCGMTMFGSDSDRSDIFRRTIDFYRENKLDYLQAMAQTPLPGTPWAAHLERESRILHKIWRFYDALHVVHRPANMAPYELQEGIIQSYRDFYSGRNMLGDVGRAIKGTLPSPHVLAMKLVGRLIVEEWARYNMPYRNMLRTFS